jgi:polysaccharide export outer membrane protein
MQLQRHWLILLVFVTLTGCASLKKAPDQDVVIPPRTFVANAYIIGKNDRIQVDVWRNTELTRPITVRPDGFITMPLIGDIKADGRKPEELAAVIAEGLKRIIKQPEVTVTVINPASIEYLYRVRAMGEVAQPVSIPYVDGITVMDLVLAAGGVSPYGAGKRAVLSRMTKDGYRDYVVDIDAILNEGDITTNFTLQPTDILTVPEKNIWRGEF